MAEKATTLTGHYKLKISPAVAGKAIAVLSAYVEERVQLVEDKKIATIPVAVKLQESINAFAEAVGSQVKAPAEALYNRMRFTVVPELMDAEGVDSIGVEGVGKVHLQDDISCKVQDAEAMQAWLTANGLEDIIKETVNAQTLAASMRRRMAENAKSVKAMEGEVDPTKLLPMPTPDVCLITPVVRAVIKK